MTQAMTQLMTQAMTPAQPSDKNPFEILGEPSGWAGVIAWLDFALFFLRPRSGSRHGLLFPTVATDVEESLAWSWS